MDIYYQVKHRLQGRTLFRNFDITRWFPSSADGRVDGRVITKNFSDNGLPNFLGCGALRPLGLMMIKRGESKNDQPSLRGKAPFCFFLFFCFLSTFDKEQEVSEYTTTLLERRP